MTSKLPVLFSLLLLSGTAFAADDLINADIERAMQKSNQEVLKSVDNMNKTLEKVMPELTQTMAQNLSQVLNSLTPVMEALEKNQTFSKASEKIAKDVAKSINELDIPNTKVDTDDNYLSVKGYKTENDQNLQFAVNQNPNLILNTSNFITLINKGNKNEDLSVLTLDNKIIPLKEFNTKTINGHDYLVYSNEKDQYTFLSGNINPSLNIQVQTTGENHENKAENFIQSMRGSLGASDNTTQAPKKIRLFPQSN